MTAKRKIEILKRIKRLIKNGDEECLCWAYGKATGNQIKDNKEGNQKLRQLGLQKPVPTYSYMFWFPLGVKAPRIRLINNAIKKLSK